MSGERCGWPEPVLPTGAAVAHCRRCHGRLRFDLHINQWVHDRGADR